MKHTQGPWRVDESFTELTIRSIEDEHIATIDGHLRYIRANARLIASAPNLLAACKAVRDKLEDCIHDSMAKEIGMLIRVIKQAEE